MPLRTLDAHFLFAWQLISAAENAGKTAYRSGQGAKFNTSFRGRAVCANQGLPGEWALNQRN